MGKNINMKKEKKGLGVIIINNMSPEKHINKIGETYNLLANIRVTFTYVYEDIITNW